MNENLSPLHLKHLVRQLPGFRLSVNLSVKPGERLALVAPSGFGKTTLLRLIAGLDTPDSGGVWMGEENLTVVATEKRNIGYVFQDPALFSHLSVLENVVFGLRMRGMP